MVLHSRLAHHSAESRSHRMSCCQVDTKRKPSPLVPLALAFLTKDQAMTLLLPLEPWLAGLLLFQPYLSWQCPSLAALCRVRWLR